MSTDLQDYCSTCEFVFDVSYIVPQQYIGICYVHCLRYQGKESNAWHTVFNSLRSNASSFVLLVESWSGIGLSSLGLFSGLKGSWGGSWGLLRPKNGF